MATWHKFSTSSEHNLRGVHPDLVAVTRRALELSAVDFGVTQGVRTLEEQKQQVAEGDSTTMNSRHIPDNNQSKQSCAVDVVAYVGGTVSWRKKHYQRIAQAFFRAAIEQGIQIEWGGHWVSVFDGPHFQLSWRDYP